MALTQTEYGDRQVVNALRALWNGSAALKVHLYRNNYTPTTTSVPGDMTEANYEGYATQNATNWTAAAMASGKAYTAADALIFTHTAGATSNTIYGYWVERLDDLGNVWFAEKFGSSVTLAADGDALVLYPKYTNVTE